MLPVFLAGCAFGPFSSTRVVTSNEKEVVILSDSFFEPSGTADKECGRFGKTAKLKGHFQGPDKRVYYYDCQ